MSEIERLRDAAFAVMVAPEGVLNMEEVIRAILQAMREPSKETLHAATTEIPTWDDDASRRKWQAMIDHILSE